MVISTIFGNFVKDRLYWPSDNVLIAVASVVQQCPKVDSL